MNNSLDTMPTNTNGAIDTAAMLKELTIEELKPYYSCEHGGVYYHAIETDKQGNIQEKPPLRLSDAIELIGRGIDSAGNHYRLIEWQDRITRDKKRGALAMAGIGSDWAALLRLGITIASGRRKRELLADYLQTEGANTAYRITEQTGWHDEAYILPNGEIIANDNARLFYNGDKSQAKAYQQSGSLSDWQAEVARYMPNNSRLCLAIGTALAAPLLSLLGIESGGFHLYGDSSEGKTTALHLALSVWGNPQDLKTSWKGTDYGFANLALARNDNLLALDEIGEATPRVVTQTAYSVINGSSKIQGHKDGGNRAINHWRTLLFSTGEKTLHSYVQNSGTDWQAGQANRLPSISANAGKKLGIYDCLHGCTSGAEQSEHLEQAMSRYHGSAGRAFIQAIQSDKQGTINRLQALIEAFMSALPALEGQARRVGKRFALVAAALELAKEQGIIPDSQTSLSIRQCFDDWHKENGSGKYEDKQIIANAIEWLQRFGNSTRLSAWNDAITDKDHAGYRRYRISTENESELEQQAFWIIPAVFKTEICKSYEEKKAAGVLIEAQWLKPKIEGKTRRYQHQRADGSRYYVFIGMQPPDSGENP